MSAPQNRSRWVFFIGLALFSILWRLAPQLLVRFVSPSYNMLTVNHLWGFTPILAIALYAGAFIRNPWQAMGFILGTQLLGDLGIWALSGDIAQGFDPGVYVAYPLCTLLGRPLNQHHSLGRVLTGSVLSASVFFLVTNFIVWGVWGRLYQQQMYPSTLAGLIECYVQAIPFAKQFIATPLYAGLLFSPLGIAMLSEPQQSARPQELVVQN